MYQLVLLVAYLAFRCHYSRLCCCVRGDLRQSKGRRATGQQRIPRGQRQQDVPKVIPTDIAQLLHPGLKHLWPVRLRDECVLLGLLVFLLRYEKGADRFDRIYLGTLITVTVAAG